MIQHSVNIIWSYCPALLGLQHSWIQFSLVLIFWNINNWHLKSASMQPKVICDNNEGENRSSNYVALCVWEVIYNIAASQNHI